MSIRLRLQRLEEHASELTRKLQAGWRHVTLREGVEPTPKQRAIIEYNNRTSGNGVGFRTIIIRPHPNEGGAQIRTLPAAPVEVALESPFVVEDDRDFDVRG